MDGDIECTASLTGSRERRIAGRASWRCHLREAFGDRYFAFNEWLTDLARAHWSEPAKKFCAGPRGFDQKETTGCAARRPRRIDQLRRR